MGTEELAGSQPSIKVLFVCMGNICRSPTAQGVLRQLLVRERLSGRVWVDSAGTHDYHLGRPADERARQTASRRGIDLSDHRARTVRSEDFIEYDYILAMDRDNLGLLTSLCPTEHVHKLRLLIEYAPDLGFGEVPDPYYGGRRGFEQVIDLIESACEGLIAELRNRLD